MVRGVMCILAGRDVPWVEERPGMEREEAAALSLGWELAVWMR